MHGLLDLITQKAGSIGNYVSARPHIFVVKGRPGHADPEGLKHFDPWEGLFVRCHWFDMAGTTSDGFALPRKWSP